LALERRGGLVCATGTYLIVFLTADTGDYVMALGGERFGK
jgi:hypothetical protein